MKHKKKEIKLLKYFLLRKYQKVARPYESHNPALQVLRNILFSLLKRSVVRRDEGLAQKRLSDYFLTINLIMMD